MNALTAISAARPLTVSTCDRRADTTGTMRDHDDLVVALARYHDEPFSTARLGALYLTARQCGMPAGETDVLAWSERRLSTYRGMTAEATSLMGRG